MEHTSSICSISWGPNYPGKQQGAQRDANTPKKVLDVVLKGSRRAEEEEKVDDGEPGMHCKHWGDMRHRGLKSHLQHWHWQCKSGNWAEKQLNLHKTNTKKIHGGKIRWEITATVLLLCACHDSFQHSDVCDRTTNTNVQTWHMVWNVKQDIQLYKWIIYR